MLTSGSGKACWPHSDGAILQRRSWRIMAYEGGCHHPAITRHVSSPLSSCDPL